jgi:hypothetical protein
MGDQFKSGRCDHLIVVTPLVMSQGRFIVHAPAGQVLAGRCFDHIRCAGVSDLSIEAIINTFAIDKSHNRLNILMYDSVFFYSLTDL